MIFICHCCGKDARWCGDGGNELEPHECDHIHCDHCGMHYSLETDEAATAETIEELRDMMFRVYCGKS